MNLTGAMRGSKTVLIGTRSHGLQESRREVSGDKSQEPAWGGVSGAMETGIRAVEGLTLNLGEWRENDHRASRRSAKGIGGELL